MSEKEEVRNLPIYQIENDRNQPRKSFDKAALEELADSIRRVGMIQPIVVRRDGDCYRIIAGERRWRAAHLIGMKEIPAIIRDDVDDLAVSEMALIENIQREDLNPVEEARAYRRLVDDYGLTVGNIAERMGKNASTISNSLRLLKLAPDVLTDLSEGKISEGHARAILGVDDGEIQKALSRRVQEDHLSVRQTEKEARALKKEAKAAAKAKPTAEEELLNAKKMSREARIAAMYQQIGAEMAEFTGTKVDVTKTGATGKIVIEFYNEQDLERIYDILQSGANEITE